MMQDLRSQVEHLEARRGGLEQDVSDLDVTVHHRQDLVSTLERQHTELLDSIAESTSRHDQLLDSNAEATVTLASHHQEIQDATTALALIVKPLHDARSKLEAVSYELEERTAALDHVHDGLQQTQASLNTTNVHLTDTQRRLNSTTVNLTAAQAELSATQSRISTQKEELRLATNEAGTVRRRTEDTRAELERSRSLLDRAHHDFDKARADIDEQKSSARARLSALRAQIAEAEATLTEKESRTAEITTEGKKRSKQLKSLAAEIDSVRAAKEQERVLLEDTNKRIQHDIRAASATLDALRTKITQEGCQLSALGNDVSVALRRLTEIERLTEEAHVGHRQAMSDGMFAEGRASHFGALAVNAERHLLCVDLSRREAEVTLANLNTRIYDRELHLASLVEQEFSHIGAAEEGVVLIQLKGQSMQDTREERFAHYSIEVDVNSRSPDIPLLPIARFLPAQEDIRSSPFMRSAPFTPPDSPNNQARELFPHASSTPPSWPSPPSSDTEVAESFAREYEVSSTSGASDTLDTLVMPSPTQTLAFFCTAPSSPYDDTLHLPIEISGLPEHHTILMKPRLGDQGQYTEQEVDTRIDKSGIPLAPSSPPCMPDPSIVRTQISPIEETAHSTPAGHQSILDVMSLSDRLQSSLIPRGCTQVSDLEALPPDVQSTPSTEGELTTLASASPRPSVTSLPQLARRMTAASPEGELLCRVTSLWIIC
jgi:predicted  nucleic acid-binding Zn-ribbon protein